MKSGEYEGIWWLPKKTKFKTRGKLTISSEELTLEIKGHLQDLNRILGRRPSRHVGLISGQLDDGRFITLHNSTLFFFGGSPLSTKYTVDYVFEGVHFKKIKDINSKTVTIVFKNLDEWSAISGFNFKPPFLIGDKVLVKYTNPKTIRKRIGDNMEFELHTHNTHGGIHFPVHEIHLKQESFLKIHSRSNMTLQEITEVIRSLQNFFTFALGVPFHPVSMALEIDGSIIPKKDYNVKYADLIYRTITSTLPESKIHESRVYFRYPEIKRRLSSILTNWFEKKEDLEPIFRLYFATIYNRNMYLEQEFLYLAHAIEAYHRLTMKNYDLPKRQHKNRLKIIERSLPTRYKDWTVDKLQFSNEPTLNTRLLEIIQKYSYVLGNSSSTNAENFTKKFRWTRNYLTHYDNMLRDKSLKGSKLGEFNHKLGMILDLILLSEIGFKKNEIKSKLQNKMRNYGIRKIIE